MLHLECNIKASWLLETILDETNSGFNLLEKETRMQAIEAALFMIGYEVSGCNL